MARIVCALALVACERGAASSRDREQSAAARPSAVPRPAPGPAALREAMGIPAGVSYEPMPENPTAPVSTRKLKTQGPVGDWLEGDVFWFRAVAVRRCEGSPRDRRRGRNQSQVEADVFPARAAPEQRRPRLSREPRAGSQAEGLRAPCSKSPG